MAQPEKLEQKPHPPQTAEEAFRQAALDIARAWAGPAADTTGTMTSLANINKALPAIQVVDIAGKVKDLGDMRFPVREQASKELEKIGAAALPQLVQAQKDPDLEVARRANTLVERLIWGQFPEVESRTRAPRWRGLDARTNAEISSNLAKTIKDIDTISSNPARVQQRLLELQAVKQYVTLDESGNVGVERQMRELKNIRQLSGETRVQLASFLAGTGQSAESKQLLNEAMAKNPKVTASYDFMKTACVIGADRDPMFHKSFLMAGGNNAVLNQVRQEKPLAATMYNGARDSVRNGMNAVQMKANELANQVNKLFPKK
jgi:hypothetical protein